MLYMFRVIIYFKQPTADHFILKIISMNFLYPHAIITGLFKTAEWSV